MNCPYCGERPLPESVSHGTPRTCGDPECIAEHDRRRNRVKYVPKQGRSDTMLLLTVEHDPAGIAVPGCWLPPGRVREDLAFDRKRPPLERIWRSGTLFRAADGRRLAVAGHELVTL